MPLALFRTVRSKLLLAFCLIVGLSVAIGSIGWSGFSDSERALNSLRDHSLPNIDKAMELARRSSAVASIAPFLSSIQVMNKLNAENEKLEAQLAELKAMVDALEPLAPGDKPPAGSLHDLASRMASNLQSLVQNTHDSLDIRSDMLELAYAFERRGKIEARLRVQAGGPGASSVRLEAFKGLTETIFAAIGNDNPVEIGELQKAFAGFSRELTPKDGSVDGTTVLSSGDPETDAFVKLQSRVFDIRRREIAAHQTTQYLLASIHALSTQMSDKVADVASNISQSVQAESARTNAALENGKNRILLLTLICLLASAAAVTYVLRNLAGNLQTITTAISRLASGDRTTHVPAVERADEIGILARAFNVFKEQSFDREALASDLIAKSRVLEATFANMADGLSVFDEKMAASRPGTRSSSRSTSSTLPMYAPESASRTSLCGCSPPARSWTVRPVSRPMQPPCSASARARRPAANGRFRAGAWWSSAANPWTAASRPSTPISPSGARWTGSFDRPSTWKPWGS